MEQARQWLQSRITEAMHDLQLPSQVVVFDPIMTTSAVSGADVVWLPQLDLHSLSSALRQQFQHQELIVSNEQVKESLIEQGQPGEQIVVCPFWGPKLTEWAVEPAEWAEGQHQTIDLSAPVSVAISRAHRLGGFSNLSSAGLAEFIVSLLAGVPVVVPDSLSLAKTIQRYHLGTTTSATQDVPAEQYQRWAQNSAMVGRMILENAFVKQALLEATTRSQMRHTDVANDHPRYGIRVMDSMATLDYIAQHHCSVARLGDGEISLLLGAAQVFQDEDAILQRRLDAIVKTPSDDHLLVCLSDTFHDLDRYVPSAQDWWRGHLNVFKDYYQQLGKLNHQYGNTMVTRPYMDLQDRHQAGEIFRRIKQWWEQRDVLIVEGALTRSGVGNDLYDNAKSVQRIICPPKNAWSKYQEIEAAIRQYGQGKLVLVMLGMAATVIAADLADWGQVIDSGHLDPEYEWYRMGAIKRVPIQGKHTAEMNYDQGVPQQIDDPQYQAEIILDLSK